MRRKYYGQSLDPPTHRKVHLFHEPLPPVKAVLRDTHPALDKPLPIHKYEGSPKQEILYESRIRKNNYGPHVGGREVIGPAPREPVMSKEGKLEMEIKTEVNDAIKAEKDLVHLTDSEGNRVYGDTLEDQLTHEDWALLQESGLFWHRPRRRKSNHNPY